MGLERVRVRKSDTASATCPGSCPGVRERIRLEHESVSGFMSVPNPDTNPRVRVRVVRVRRVAGYSDVDVKHLRARRPSRPRKWLGAPSRPVDRLPFLKRKVDDGES